MNWIFPPKSHSSLGIILLRLAAGYYLLHSAYLTAITLHVGQPGVFSVLQEIDLFISIIGALSLTFGFVTRIMSLVVFIWLLFIHTALQVPAHDLIQLLIFLALYLFGPGQLSLDKKIFRKAQTPAMIRGEES